MLSETWLECYHSRKSKMIIEIAILLLIFFVLIFIKVLWENHKNDVEYDSLEQSYFKQGNAGPEEEEDYEPEEDEDHEPEDNDDYESKEEDEDYDPDDEDEDSSDHLIIRAKRQLKPHRILFKLIIGAMALYTGNHILESIGKIINGTTSPFYSGLTLIGWSVTEEGTIHGTSSTGFIALTGLILIVLVIAEFIEPGGRLIMTIVTGKPIKVSPL